MLRATACAIALLSAATARGETYEVRTPHFTVITDAGRSTGESIARRVESIQRLFEEAFAGKTLGHRDHTIVLAFSNHAAMAELLPSIWEDESARKPDGVFREGIDKDYIVVRLDAPSEGPYATVYHEAFHVFARNRFGLLPLWLDEGLAKFWESTGFDSERVRIGGVSRRNLKTLSEEPLLPLPALFAVDQQSPHYRDKDDSELFYAQSWAVVHYLLLGDVSGEHRRQLLQFLQTSDSRNERGSSQHPFDDLGAVTQAVNDYTTARRFKAIERDAPSALARGALQTRTLSEAEALAVRADFLVHGEQPQRARAVFEKAFELDPDLALVHEGFGFMALEDGNTQAALDAFARAGELDSSSFLAHYYHAVASLRAGASLELVLARLDRSINANSEFAPAHLFVATAVAELGDDYERGLASADKLVELTPTDPEAHLIRGRLLVAVGDEEAGKTSYQTALALPTDEARIYRELAVDLLEIELFDEASTALEFASALDPEDPETVFTLALTLAEAGRVDEAIQAFETAAALAPDVARYHYRLAELLIETGRASEAVPALERSLELNPDAIALRRDLGRALLAAGDAGAAIPHLRAALEQSPRLGSLHYQLATALAATGDTEQAAHHLRLSQELGYEP